MFAFLLHPFKCLFGSTTADETEHVHAGTKAPYGTTVDQAGGPPEAGDVADWPQLSTVSASVMASPKRKRGDLQAEADEDLITKYTEEPAAGRKRPVLDPALVSAEAFTLRSPSKTIPRTPVADTGLDPLKGSDSFKFATPVMTDAKTPIGGGVFLSSRAAAAAAAAAANTPTSETAGDKMQPAKLALVPEAQEEEKIKAQHSIGSTPADSSLEEHAAKKLKSADGSTNMETPLLKEQEKSRSKSLTPGFVVSASETDSPQVSGISNPATNFKESKPVRVHGTPFETRMEKEIEREDRFSSGAKADFRGRLSDIVANQAMQLRASPAPSNRSPWR